MSTSKHPPAGRETNRLPADDLACDPGIGQSAQPPLQWPERLVKPVLPIDQVPADGDDVRLFVQRQVHHRVPRGGA